MFAHSSAAWAHTKIWSRHVVSKVVPLRHFAPLSSLLAVRTCIRVGWSCIALRSKVRGVGLSCGFYYLPATAHNNGRKPISIETSSTNGEAHFSPRVQASSNTASRGRSRHPSAVLSGSHGLLQGTAPWNCS